MTRETILDPDAPTSEPTNDVHPAEFTSRLEGDAVLRCSGELDSATTPALRRSLERVVRLAPDRIVVDLSRVSFFGAGAIGEFVRARNACRATRADLVVRGPSPFGRRVLDGVGLTNLIADEPQRATDPNTTSSTVDADELVAAWDAACATARYGATSLRFDPTEATAVLARLIDDPSSVARAEADVSLSALSGDEADSATALMQLWALRDVLYSGLETHRAATLESAREGRRHVELEAALAGMASSAVTELEQATLLDPLTGLLNRRALDRDLLQSLAAASRRQQFLSLVMIDIEGLKATNDRFGHAAGDDTLRGVATSLTSALRAGDNAYRVGGDEFVLLLPELRPDDVDGVMERTTVECRGAFTWGCACVKCDDDATPYAEQATHLLELADQRMLDFRARARGSRDRVDVSLSPMPALAEPTAELAGRFTAANRSSVVIDEAKGLIAEQLDVGIDEASTLLGEFCAEQRQPVLAVASALMNRTISVARLAPDGSGDRAAADGDPELHSHGSAAAGER